MENIFIDNPIIVNVLNVDSFTNRKQDNDKRSNNKKFTKKIKQQVVWINTDDPKIVAMWKAHNIVKLKKQYGSSIQNVLGTHHGKTEGGDDIEDIDVTDMDEITFDDDDLDDLLRDDEEDEIKTKKEMVVDVEKPFIFVKDIYVFPEDKVSEFKKKIYVSTGIPPFRQHLWYEFKGKTYPLSYVIKHETVINVDIRDLVDHVNYYEGIPVDTLWYAEKEDLRVTAMDEFQLLEHIYYKHGVTEYFVADLNDFINPIRGNLERFIKRDMYSVELIYYSFIMKYWPQLSLTSFGEYVKNEEILLEKYPELAPGITGVKDMYKHETNIIGKNYSPEMNSKKWDVPLYVSITYSVITVTEQYILPGSVVHLRNMFDVFKLNETVNYIMCNIEVNGRPVLLTKRYKTTTIPSTKVAVNAIIFNINIPGQGNMSLIINKQGNYKIESRWREDQYFNFGMIYSQVETYVKPVIEKINTFGKMVSTNPLTIIKNDNSVFTEINLSMFWKFNMSKKKFSNVKDILNQYINAGIMVKSTSGVSISHDYYFTKGMYKYEMGMYRMMNPVQNQYQYLTDGVIKNRHDTLTIKRKRLSITHRFSDIKIEFTGLKEQEYVTFYIYIVRLLASIPRVKGEKQTTTVKKLKQLKEKDPSLYEFKKIYDSKKNYSKLCQQKKQPIMYNEPGKNRVKFWNFTTNETVFYGCPNPNYPYINFRVDVHPKNFCIPCCYKLPPSTNPKDKKGQIYKVCMADKKYEKNKKSLSNTRHVLAYGKDIEVGRLSKLPENTLEPLFYDTFSTTAKGIDEECGKDKGYYLFGVPQNINNVSSVGFLFSVSHALKMNIIDFVYESIKRIKKKCECWNILMGGTISHHFHTFTDFVNEINDVFINNKLSVFEYWNDLFIDIAIIYWDLAVIHFIDDSTGNESNSIHLNIPGYIQYRDDYMSTNMHLIVIEREKTFYPVYVINKDIFFKIGTINMTLYNYTDNVIGEIYNMVSYHIRQEKFKESIDLHLIKKFTKNSKYNIESQYINTANFCYGVTLKYISSKKVVPFYDIPDSNIETQKVQNLNDENYWDLVGEFNKQTKKSKEKSFFIPLVESYYKTDGTFIVFENPNTKTSPSWNVMSAFIDELNMFIKKYSSVEINDPQSRQTLYPLIVVDNWLLYEPLGVRSSKRKVIGFRCQAHNYLIQHMDEKDATKLRDVKMIKMIYDPHDVNGALSKKLPPVKDDRFKKIASSLYNNYLYPILIIELINVMDKQRNTNVRKKLSVLVKKFTSSNPQNKELYNLLKDYPSDYKTVKKLLINNLTVSTKKKAVIEDFVNKKTFNKSDIISIIENSMFDFDRKMFDNLKKMSHNDLVGELMSIFSKITVDAEPKFEGDFPNMIMSCEINHPYCRNKKLMIMKSKLKDILNIMAADILNPVKAKYIFSPIFVKNTIDYFKFIIREDEHIMISI
jgi:hypothetical protein